MNNIAPRSSIRQAPGSFTPRLRNRHLKKPPSPIDWVEQSYIELIQDVSLMTMKYYETRINQHNAASQQDETLSILQSLHDGIEALDYPNSEDETNEDDDDNYTQTTASSVYDLRNNLYQFYRDHARQEEGPQMSELSLITTESAGYISPDDVSIITTDTDLQYRRKEPVQRKKKIFSRMIERMKLAAEKPFGRLKAVFDSIINIKLVFV